ncbi:MAG TPA: hypothetical protein VND67_02300 [Acidimicrobiales bacterium]|nr:hypothetical protein [Acidimicrobiales bacterium]
MPTGMLFKEAMSGTWQPTTTGTETDSARLGGGLIRFDVVAETTELVRPFGTVSGRLSGTLSAAGLADQAPAIGTIEVSPIEHRRIRYTLDFPGGDGTSYRFDGWKSIEWIHALSTWTTLPGTITGPDNRTVGTATLRFAWKDAPSLMASVRMRRSRPTRDAVELAGRRWDGRAGRLEVWYDTFTDAASGTGFWLHHEIVAPSGPASPAFAHGWIAVFPPDGRPVWERFGPSTIGAGPWFSAGDEVRAEPGLRTGRAGSIRWDLRFEDRSAPLFTFPAAAWDRELLPAAQIVPSPTAEYRGSIVADGQAYELAGARGASARIYGHGNAERWAWLHADLGGGDVLEVVAATSRRRGLDRLRPLPFVRLRFAGQDWPAAPMAALRFRARLALPTWTVTGRWRDRRLRVTVTQPDERCVRLGYTDPDGASATCTNSERADAHVVLERRSEGAWVLEHEWSLDGTAHAEVGTRP